MSEQKFETYAVVEIMGHQTYAGFVSEPLNIYMPELYSPRALAAASYDEQPHDGSEGDEYQEDDDRGTISDYGDS